MQLWFAVAALLLGLFLAAQAPLRLNLDLGAAKGVQRADAFVFDFYPPEKQGEATFRWSREHSGVALQGIGQQSVTVALTILAHRAQFQQPEQPTRLTISANGHPVLFDLRRPAGRYTLLVPATWVPNGSLELLVSTPPWQAPGDGRAELGLALERVDVHGLGGLRLPFLPVAVAWLVALLATWFTLRVCGFAPNRALLLCTPLVLVPVLATVLLPAYLALGSAPLLIAGAWGLAILFALNRWLPELWVRLGLVPNRVLLRWLALIVAASFALRYAGRLFPASMYGDLDLHWHRYARTLSGTIYILAAHRGLPFPFPGALYILSAPFQLLGIEPWVVMEFGGTLMEASTPLLLALIAARCLGSLRTGVAAAAVYGVMAGGFMTTWFAFETHIFAQWAMLLLWTIVLFCWPQAWEKALAGLAGGRWTLAVALLVVTQAWVYLGHTGFLLNTVTLLALGLPLLLWRTWHSPYRRAALQLSGAVLAGGATVAAVYYSAFLPMILQQLGGVAQVGLLEVTGRRPVDPAETLRAIWEDGLLTHYGFFPLPLALAGLVALGRRERGINHRALLWWLLALTLLVSVSQAVLPLITRSTLTTRYLMFAAWAVSLLAAPVLAALWRRGRAGRFAVLAMAASVAFGTLAQWLGAMAFNLAPPEPF